MTTFCTKLIWRIGLLLLCLGCFFRSPAIAAPEDPLPKEWTIDLEPAFKLLGEQLQSAPQQGMNRISGGQFGIRDVELCIAYFRLWIRLSAKEREKLKADQAKWLVARKQAAAKAAEGEKGGSVAPTEYNLAATQWTEKRQEVLRKRIANVADDSADGIGGVALPKGWRPGVQGAINWLEGDSEDGPITAISRNRHLQAQLHDAELAVVYLELWSRLDDKARQTLRAEQARWLATRTEKAAAAAAARADSEETLAALDASHAFVKLTTQRAAELRKRISAKSSKPPKG